MPVALSFPVLRVGDARLSGGRVVEDMEFDTGGLMRRVVLPFAVLSLAVLLCGCVTSSAGIAPSTRPLAPDGYTLMTDASGTSWGFSLLGIIPLKQANTAAALDEALQDRGADALVQVTVDNRSSYLLLFTFQRIKVEGLAARAK